MKEPPAQVGGYGYTLAYRDPGKQRVPSGKSQLQVEVVLVAQRGHDPSIAASAVGPEAAVPEGFA